MSAARKKPAQKSRKESPAVDLRALGARVVSVYGPFNSRVLIEMPADKAAGLFPEPLGACGLAVVLDGVVRDLEAIAAVDEALAGSGLAGVAMRLAYELEHPYNSATSKAACARELRETQETLRALAPAEEESDGLDDLAAKRDARRAKAAG